MGERRIEQIPVWRAELLSEREALKKAGIVERNTGDELIWYFDEAIKWRTAKINSKGLESFPNREFNRDEKIGSDDGAIRSL